MAIVLVQYPVVVKALGVENFGLWAGVGSFFLFSLSLDFGVGMYIQNIITDCLARDARDQLELELSNCVAGLALVGGGLFLLAIGASAVLVGTGFGHISLLKAVVVAAFLAGLAIPGAVGQRLSIGLQQGWHTSVATLCTSIIGLGLTFICAGYGVDLWVFVLSSYGPLALSGIVLFLVEGRGIGVRLRGPISFRVIIKVFRAGLHYVPTGIAAMCIAHGPIAVLGAHLGGGGIAVYAIAQRMIGIFTQVQSVVVNPLWPAYRDALARNELDWVRRVYRNVLVVSLLAAIAVIVIAIPGFRPAAQLWLGAESIQLDSSIAVVSGLWIFASYISTPVTMLLNAAGRLKQQNVAAIVQVGSILVVGPVLVRYMGVAGVILSVVAPWLLLTVPVCVTDARRVLDRGLVSQGC